jgi:hypothetical protein
MTCAHQHVTRILPAVSTATYLVLWPSIGQRPRLRGASPTSSLECARQRRRHARRARFNGGVRTKREVHAKSTCRPTLTWTNAFMERRVRIKMRAHVARRVYGYIYRGIDAHIYRGIEAPIYRGIDAPFGRSKNDPRARRCAGKPATIGAAPDLLLTAHKAVPSAA